MIKASEVIRPRNMDYIQYLHLSTFNIRQRRLRLLTTQRVIQYCSLPGLCLCNSEQRTYRRLFTLLL